MALPSARRAERGSEWKFNAAIINNKLLLKRRADSVYYWTVKSPIWQWSMLYWDDFYRAHHRGNSSLLFALARVIEIIVSPAIWNWRRLIIRGPPPDNSYAAGFCFRSYLLKNFYSKHHWNFYNWTFIFDALLIKLKKYVIFCIVIRYVKILDYMGRVNLNLCCDQKFYWTCRLQNLMKLIRI